MATIESHLDNLTMRPAHWRLGLSAGLGIFLDGYDLSMMAVAIIFIKAMWHLTPTSLGLLAASTLMGAIAGGAIGGRFADIYGRKWLYLIDIATFFFAALLSATAWNVWSLIFFRFLLGIGIGVDYPLSATFLAEFAPRASRGRMMTWSFALFSLGGVAALVAAYFFSALGPQSWRLLFASGAIPALGLLVLRRTLPESPRWHLQNNDRGKALTELCRFNPEFATADSDLLPPHAPAQPRTNVFAAWRVLFTPRYIRRTVLVTVPWFIMDVVDYGFNIYVPTLLMAFGMRTFGGTILLSIVLGCIALCGFTVVAASIDRVGRMRSQVLGFVGMGVGMAGLAAFAMAGTTPIVPIAICMLFVRISNLFPDITTWVLPVELFPTGLRASAHGFATSFSRVGAATSVFLFPILSKVWGLGPLLLAIAALQIVAAVVTARLAFEPARCSLEEIAAA